MRFVTMSLALAVALLTSFSPARAELSRQDPNAITKLYRQSTPDPNEECFECYAHLAENFEVPSSCSDKNADAYLTDCIVSCLIASNTPALNGLQAVGKQCAVALGRPTYENWQGFELDFGFDRDWRSDR